MAMKLAQPSGETGGATVDEANAGGRPKGQNGIPKVKAMQVRQLMWTKLSASKIAQELQLNYHTVRDIVRRLRADGGSVVRKHGSGRKKRMSPSVAGRGRKIIEDNPRISQAKVRKAYQEKFGGDADSGGVSRWGVRQVIKDAGLKPFKTVRVSGLTAKQKQNRLKACVAYKKMIDEGELDLTKLVMSDEKMFRCNSNQS